MRSARIKTLVHFSLSIVMAHLLTGPLCGQFGGLSEQDEQELKSVVLTVDSLTKLVKTLEAYVGLLRTDTELREMQQATAEEDDEGSFSIDAMANGLEQLPPRVMAALTSQGLTPRQYSVLTMTALVNGIAYAGSGTSNRSGPLPPGATAGNIEFIQQHANSPILQQWRQLVMEMDELEGGDEDDEEE